MFRGVYRASLDRVGRITFDVPDVRMQNEAMNDVLSLENGYCGGHEENRIAFRHEGINPEEIFIENRRKT